MSIDPNIFHDCRKFDHLISLLIQEGGQPDDYRKCSTTVLGTLKSYKYAQVGSRKYTADEHLRGMLTKKGATRRCGSLGTCDVGGKSYYFHVIEFISCEYRGRDQELAFVTWLPTPTHPTPWRTQLSHNSPPPPFNPFVFLIDIIPARLLIETDANHHYHITRIDGVDQSEP